MSHTKKEEHGGKYRRRNSENNNTYGEVLMLGNTHTVNVRNDQGVSCNLIFYVI